MREVRNKSAKLTKTFFSMSSLPEGSTLVNNILTLTDNDENIALESYVHLFDSGNLDFSVAAMGGNDYMSGYSINYDPIRYNWWLYGGDGNDTFQFASSHAGDDYSIFGGSGFDEINYQSMDSMPSVQNGKLVLTIGSNFNQGASRITINSDVEIFNRMGGWYYLVDELLNGVQRFLGFDEYNEYKATWEENNQNTTDNNVAHTSGVTATSNANSIPYVDGYVYRLRNDFTGKFIFSANSGEIDIITGQGWVNEGAAYASPADATTNLHRFSMANGGHFYTANTEEKNILSQDSSFSYDGVAYQVYSTAEPPQGSIPVVRFLSNTGSHLYSTSELEQSNLNASAQWTNEGIAWYGANLT